MGNELNYLGHVSKEEMVNGICIENINFKYVTGNKDIFIAAIDLDDVTVYVDDNWFKLSSIGRIVAVLHELAYINDASTKMAYHLRGNIVGRLALCVSGIDSEFLADSYVLECLSANDKYKVLVTGSLMEMAALGAAEYGGGNELTASLVRRSDRLRKKLF